MLLACLLLFVPLVLSANAPGLARRPLPRVIIEGGMIFPRSRNVDNPKGCPLCADGAGICGGGPRSRWDRSAETDGAHNQYYVDPPVRVVSDGLLEVSFAFQKVVSGGGVVTVELCEQPSYPMLNETCFRRLNRDPTDTAISPYATDYPHVFFLPDNRCLDQATWDNPMQARFLVESKATTAHSLIRWQFQPAESCDPTPTELDAQLAEWQVQWRQHVCHIPLTRLPKCGRDCPTRKCRGRTFRNCADIALVGPHTTTTTQPPKPALIKLERNRSDNKVDNKVANILRRLHQETSSSNEDENENVDAANNDEVNIDEVNIDETNVGLVINKTDDQSSNLSSSLRGIENVRRSLEGAELPVVSIRNFEVDVLHVAPEEDTDYCGTDFPAQIEECETHISDRAGTEKGFCSARCALVANSSTSPSRRWCINNGVCELTACVGEYWANVCQAPAI